MYWLCWNIIKGVNVSVDNKIEMRLICKDILCVMVFNGVFNYLIFYDKWEDLIILNIIIYIFWLIKIIKNYFMFNVRENE